MSDTTTAPDASTIDPALIRQLLQQTVAPQPVALPQGPTASTSEGRGWLSLLGEALGGGQQYGTTPEREAGGIAALGALGRRMLEASDYSYQRHSLGSIIGQGMDAAGEALGQRQQVSAAQQAANLDYQQKQQEMQLARVKEAVPLLTLLQTQQQLANARNIALGNKPNTSIGAVGGDTYEAAIGGHEGLGPDPHLPSTVGGFRPDTWQGFVAANPTLFAGMTPDQIAAARSDPKLNAAGISWLAQQNADALNKAGVTPSGPALGVAHYLGAGAASKVLKAPDSDPVSKYVSADAVRYNPELGTMTVGQLKQRYANVPAPSFLAPATVAKPGAPVVAGAPPNLPPSAVVGDAAHPELAPGPPGSTGGAPTPIGAAFAPGGAASPVAPHPGGPQYTVTPPPQIRAQPIPAGRTTAENVQADVAAMQAGRQIAQATPAPSGVLAAGPAAGPSATAPAVATATAPPPQPGWGTVAGSYGDGAPPAGPPAQTPPVVTQPLAPPPAGPPRVPDQPPPYVRGALPPDLKAQIDHPTVDPALERAVQIAAQSGDIKAMADARAAVGAAVDKARAEAVTRGEAYHTAQQNIGVEAWKVQRAEQAASDQKQAEFQQQNATAAATRAQEERMKSIESANTRLNAEASKQLERNDTIAKTYGASRDAGMNIVSNIDQVMPALKNLPDKAAPLLQNEQTRSSLASMFGWADPELSKHIDAADLFEQGMNRIATQLSPLAPVGTEKASMVSQYRSLLPTLAQSPEGRELGLQYARDLARNGIDSMNWITEHKEDPAYMNKRLGVPDFDRALIGLQRDGPKMPKMPPIPSTFDPSRFTPEDRAASARYMAAIKPGQPYYAWQPGDDGHLHPVRYDWQPGPDGKLRAAPSDGGG